VLDALERDLLLDVAEIHLAAVQRVLLARMLPKDFLGFVARHQGLGLAVGQFVVADPQRGAQDVERGCVGSSVGIKQGRAQAGETRPCLFPAS
jgi:hypothetical protein